MLMTHLFNHILQLTTLSKRQLDFRRPIWITFSSVSTRQIWILAQEHKLMIALEVTLHGGNSYCWSHKSILQLWHYWNLLPSCKEFLINFLDFLGQILTTFTKVEFSWVWCKVLPHTNTKWSLIICVIKAA